MKHYHAHVYFPLSDYDQGKLLFQKAAEQRDLFRAVMIYNRKVGPHPLPMFELHFNEQTKEGALAWLRGAIGERSALIHEDTGDDYRDHTVGHQWIGPELPIDFSFFELIKRDPSQTIHKN